MTNENADKVKVHVYHMGWFNIYIPLYLAACILEGWCYGDKEGNPDKESLKRCCLSDECKKECKNEDCYKHIIAEKGENIKSIIGKYEFAFCEKKSDQAIVEAVKEKNLAEGINIGLCDRSKIEYEDKLAFYPFINRLPIWGIADIELLKENSLIEEDSGIDLPSQFQGVLSDYYRQIKRNLKELREGKKLHIYTYSKGSTLHALMQDGIEVGATHIAPLFEKNESKICINTIDNLNTIGKAKEEANQNNNDPWIAFTVEPSLAYQEMKKHNNLGIVYCGLPQPFDFTVIVYKKEKNDVPIGDIVNNITRAVQITTDALYKGDFFENTKKSSSAIEAYYQYRRYKHENCNEIGDELQKERSDKTDDKNQKQIDMMEWEIFSHQRIYAFDMLEISKNWERTFKKLGERIKQKFEKDGSEEQTDSDTNKRCTAENVIENWKSLFVKTDIQDLNKSEKDLLEILGELDQERQRYSIKAAAAAIMARNMSHNIGSHVVNYLKHFLKEVGNATILNSGSLPQETDDISVYNDNGTFLENGLYQFLEYLNRRMEFIAAVITAPPGSTMPVNFCKDIIQPFENNIFLRSFMARSEIGRNRQINLKLKKNGEDVDIGGACAGMEVTVPDGVIGIQAFYTILENIIRNIAKHSYSEQQCDEANGLQIIVDIEEIGDEFYKIKIYGKCKDYDALKSRIKESEDVVVEEGEKELILNPCFIDGQGRIIHNFWGIKEIFIAANFLRGRRTEEYNSKCEPPVLALENVNDNAAYTFYMLKPKALLIISEDDPQNEFIKNFSDKGVEHITYNQLKEQDFFIRHEFVLLDGCYKQEKCNSHSTCSYKEFHSFSGTSDNLNWVREHENRLPMRVFCNCLRYPKTNDIFWAEWEHEWFKENNFEFLYKKMYEKWIKSFYRELQLKTMPVVIIADQNEEVQSKWSRVAGVCATESDIKQVKNIIHNNNSNNFILFFEHIGVHHGNKLERINGKEIFFSEISAGNSTSRIIRESSDEEVQTLYWKLIETMLASVCIIDERIFNNYKKDSNAFYQKHRIRIFDFNKDKKEILGHPNNNNQLEQHTYIISDNFCECENWSFLKDGENRTDFLVIHRGIVEKIFGSELKMPDLEKFFLMLKKHVKHIIIDSGRGKPEYVDELAHLVRFVNLENLYQWFFDCKVSLVSGLMNIINREVYHTEQ